MIEIIPADSVLDYLKIEHLADVIWREHYIPIVGKPQIDYMLNKFQSVKAINEQSENGYEYYTIFYKEIPVGYISIKREEEALFLSKIYVLSDFRGKGIGKTAVTFIEEKAKAYQLEKIRLTVNKHNTNSIGVYEKLGFINMGSVVSDIGNGFVLDDYKMVKTL